MTNRLPYATKAGLPDEAATFAQLLEHLRMAQEACYVLGHLRKANGDDLTGQGFIAIGEMFALTVKNATSLATGKIGGLH